MQPAGGSEFRNHEGDMSVNASAAEAAVRVYHIGATGSGPASSQAGLGGRRVSRMPAGQGLSLRASRQGQAADGAGGAGQSGRTRAGQSGRTRRVTLSVSAPGSSKKTVPSDVGARDEKSQPAVAGNGWVPPAKAKPPERSDGQSHYLLTAPLWVTPERHAERCRAERQLKAFLRRPDTPENVKRVLAIAFHFVGAVERDTLWADGELKKIRVEPLSDARRSSLISLLAGFDQQEPWLRKKLGALNESGVLGPAAVETLEELLGELWQSFHDARRHQQSISSPWAGALRRVVAKLPLGKAHTVAVDSGVIPGTALGGRMVRGYPAECIADPRSLARFSHVQDLEQTILTGAKAERLFMGLRHSFFDAGELNCKLLSRLPVEELKALHGELITEMYPEDRFGSEQLRYACDHKASVEALLRPKRIQGYAAVLQVWASLKMATEVVAAALVANEDTYQSALSGEIVDLSLFVVAMVTDDDLAAWSNQMCAFLTTDGRAGPKRLYVRGPDGEQRAVSANVDIRQFLLSAQQEQIACPDHLKRQVELLLGPLNSPDLGGDLKVRLDVFDGCRVQTRERLLELASEHSRTKPAQGGSGDVQDRRQEFSTLTTVLQGFETHLCALESTGRQLKAMLNPDGTWPSGETGHRKAAARLALLAKLMGGTPVLSCAAGSKFTERLDPSIKFLATVAANCEGTLPPVGQDRELWAQARGKFRPQ